MKKRTVSAMLLLSASLLAGCSAKVEQPQATDPVSMAENEITTEVTENVTTEESTVEEITTETTEEATTEVATEEKEESESVQAEQKTATKKVAKKEQATNQNNTKIQEQATNTTQQINEENVPTTDQINIKTDSSEQKTQTTATSNSSSSSHKSSSSSSSSSNASGNQVSGNNTTTDGQTSGSNTTTDGQTSGNNTSSDDQKDDVNSEYKLVWNDEFDGDSLNTDIWNYELHEPGWVNNELQEYTDSTDNTYVKDGKLIIQAIKEVDDNGKVSYTSGRVNTQNKKDIKYGRVEARIKAPKGQGFLPAFWMMPTDENLYGQWPKCGEIDIMEVLGSDTKTAYSTLHFGEPHTEHQKKYSDGKSDFSEEFHTYACEWEPGLMKFYIDDELFFTENDWFTKKSGYDEVAYPAPYDQPFYVILNLAVGGNWPGNPDDTTKFDEDAQLQVDYVRVYQKDSYNENVVKPEKVVTLKDPDATGNYIINSDFSIQEDLTDEEGWKFLNALGGEATAEIKDNAIHIMTTKTGTVDYSVQLVQPNISLKQGCEYKVSFDAYAESDRKIKCAVTAPDRSYNRYLADTELDLTTEKQSYSYTFKMEDTDDANGRMEFNMGNQPSNATVVITNVRIEKVGTFVIPEPEKNILPDGNYVYNGTFDQGTNRMQYWTVEDNSKYADVSVTNNNNVRELRAVVNSDVQSLEDVRLVQKDIAITENGNYELRFKARSNHKAQIKVRINGQEQAFDLKDGNETYRFSFATGEKVESKDLEFLLGTEGTIYLDDVTIFSEGMLVNPDFSNGLTGFEQFVDGSAKADFGVDSLTEKNAACIDIQNTGAQDWCIQLKQNNVTLEKGKTYRLAFEAKCDIDRKMMFAIQRDGSKHNDDWTPYVQEKIELTSDYQEFGQEFTMEYDTDKESILSFSMGTFDENYITSKHRICIKNIKLEEVDKDVVISDVDFIESDNNFIKNCNFENGTDNWEICKNEGGVADVTAGKKQLVYNIQNVGKQDWSLQLKQGGIPFENGEKYKVSFYIQSSKDRNIRYAFLDQNNNYKWYGGEDIKVKAYETKLVENTITVTEATCDNITFALSMGIIDNDPASKIAITNIIVEKVDSGKDDTQSAISLLAEDILDKVADAIAKAEDSAQITDEDVVIDDSKKEVNIDNNVIKSDDQNNADAIVGQDDDKQTVVNDSTDKGEDSQDNDENVDDTDSTSEDTTDSLDE